MPRPRSFDHEVLKHILFRHPHWTDQMLAEELTAIARREDPNADEVKRNTVSTVLARKRDTWEARHGVDLPSRLVVFSDFSPPAGALAASHKNDVVVRYLRELAKEARGIQPRPGEDWKMYFRKRALAWRDEILAAGQLVDLDAKGVPFVRSAVMAERNPDGSPKAVAAWLLPGWRGK
jgi:hypothetical protein